MPTRDPLTGLPTRASFLRALELSVAAAHLSRTPLSLLVMALDASPDGRRASTDHGLATVSRLIRLAGGRLAISARLTEDSFAMLFAQTSLDSAFVRAQALADTTRKNAAAHDPAVTLSIGVACGPADGDWLGQELLDRARARCQAAVQAGGDVVYAFDSPFATAPASNGYMWPSIGLATA